MFSCLCVLTHVSLYLEFLFPTLPLVNSSLCFKAQCKHHLLLDASLKGSEDTLSPASIPSASFEELRDKLIWNHNPLLWV